MNIFKDIQKLDLKDLHDKRGRIIYTSNEDQEMLSFHDELENKLYVLIHQDVIDYEKEGNG